MKKIILSALAVMLLASVSSAGDDIGTALKNGKFSVDARVFYFNRNFDTTIAAKDRESLTAGATVGYVSDDFNGFKIGATYLTSNSLDIIDRHRDRGTYNLSVADSTDINIVGEAYLQYNAEKLKIKVGRQILNTPLMSRDQARTLPTSYEAATIESSYIANTTIELGYVNSMTGFGSAEFDGFDKVENEWGDNGLAYLYVTNKSVDKLALRAQYVRPLSDDYKNAGVTTKVAVEDYKYFDLKYSLPFGKNTYFSANYAGNNYESLDDSMMLGAKVGTTLGMFNLYATYVQIFDNRWQNIEDEAMFTSWQQGYLTFGPSKGLGVAASFKPMKDLSVLTRVVNVSADDFSSNAVGTGKNYANDFTEFNIDSTYVFNDWSKVRVRFSDKDFTSAANDSGQLDVQDFRIMYYIYF